MHTATLTTTIAANLERLRASLADTAQRAGRRPEEVKLIAVSKTQPPAAVAAAVAAGQRLFGENTVQDALTKIPQFADQGLEWHFIGHLQSNKARFIPGNFAWVHSLDSVKLAQRLARLTQEQKTTVNTLIEVNITRDPAKHGVALEEVATLLDQLLKANLAGIQLRGLMAIGPHPAPESTRRASFAALRKLRDDCAQRYALPTFTELSMGMSDDYIDAILEGSTLVRVGTAVFGQRIYP
jgi:pyridoxal phosphate enzyme (YggS family)